MKIIFLDIDGVLNSDKSFIESHNDKLIFRKICDYKNLEDVLKLQLFDLDFYKIELLKKIVRETNAKIVITSSWKNLKIWPLIENYLINKGLPIIGITLKLNGRGEEIRVYLKEHDEITNFIIIDDEVFRDFNELENYLIKTDFYNDGLTEDDAEEAIKILKKEYI